MDRLREISLTTCDSQDEKFVYFLEILDLYLQRLEASPQDPAQKIITLVARSPISAVAAAIANCHEAFRQYDIAVRAIFSDFAPAEAMCDWLEPETSLCTDPNNSLRWANMPRLWDAHEQLVLGTHMCWSGDTLRRNEPNQRRFYIFEEHCNETVKLAHHGFRALWDASAPIPATNILRSKQANPEHLQAAKGLPATYQSFIMPTETRH